MATVPETQAFLTEAKTPTIQPHAQTRAAVAAFVPEAGDTLQEFSVLRKLLSEAAIAEPDEGLRQKFEEGFQKIGALQREMGNAEEAARKAAAIIRALQAWYQDMAADAAALGYTV